MMDQGFLHPSGEMRIFVAGATGVIGRRLVPMLLEGNHNVVGMTRSQERAELYERQAPSPSCATCTTPIG